MTNSGSQQQQGLEHPACPPGTSGCPCCPSWLAAPCLPRLLPSHHMHIRAPSGLSPWHARTWPGQAREVGDPLVDDDPDQPVLTRIVLLAHLTHKGGGEGGCLQGVRAAGRTPNCSKTAYLIPPSFHSMPPPPYGPVQEKKQHGAWHSNLGTHSCNNTHRNATEICIHGSAY